MNDVAKEEPKTITTAPRIYNLFPRFLGTIDKWTSHLDRIKNMDFDWIYINPLNMTGFSGSLYSIKDYYKFNPIFNNHGSTDNYSWEPFKAFVEQAHKLGIKIMYDLVINHTAVDSDLIKTHEDWYLQKYAVIEKKTGYAVKFFSLDEKTTIFESEFPDQDYEIEKRIASPYAIDPGDSSKVTIWGDLAEIDNENSPDLENLAQYWEKLIEFYNGLGIDGYRCDAAYKVPASMWQHVIKKARSLNPNVLFMAETLGCTIEEMDATMEAGFDYINNSSKWWDYTAPWCMDQYDEFRKFAPSVGFPETHDTDRLAMETDGRIDVQVFKYLFAAFFSAGVMMPIGYEFGFKTRINVVEMTPDDYEDPTFDICSEIKKINRFKRSLKCLNTDGIMKHYNDYWNSDILIMKKISVDEKQQLLIIYNKDWNNEHNVKLDDLKQYLELNKPIYEITIDRDLKIKNSMELDRKLKPNECIMFLQE